MIIYDETILPDAVMSIVDDGSGNILILRRAIRGNIINKIGYFDYITVDGRSELRPLSLSVAKEIISRIKSGASYSSAFIFGNVSDIDVSLDKTQMEHQFTSTGIKFWKHRNQMDNYRSNAVGTVVSTHISPEGACNLKCPYCSVTYRDTHSRIELDVIKQYVDDLCQRGLKAVVLTGGGEPTAYKYFNDLVLWLKQRGLSVALITNGTLSDRVAVWDAFSWVRVSINFFDGWENKINIPQNVIGDNCVLGFSMVYTAEHEAMSELVSGRLSLMKRVAAMADKFNARYVRILPNCLMDQRELLLQHRAIDADLNELDDPRFFHQHKIHGAPKCGKCHQAYFRPYLSEEKYHGNDKPGTVYPCDSVVLNHGYQHFAKKYQICHASDVLKFLDGDIQMEFDPRTDCTGCVFTDNVNMLDDWVSSGISHFTEDELLHEEFI